MNKKRHLFLWGSPQAGKSTLIDKILVFHPHWIVNGFRTYTDFIKNQEDKFVYISPIQNCLWYKKDEALVGLRGPKGRRGYPGVFDKVGVKILEDFRDADLLIMDELGTMENEAFSFQKAVLQFLDMDIPILGVIKREETPFLEAVRHHPKVTTLEITPENRNDRLLEVDAFINQSVRDFRTSKSRPSCGAVVLRKVDGIWETLMIKSHQDHWSFPKGRIEEGETEQETALREILEETGLIVRIDTAFRRELPSIKLNNARCIICFLAYYVSGEARPQESEIDTIAWVPLHEAPKMAARYIQDAQVYLDAIAYLNNETEPYTNDSDVFN